MTPYEEELVAQYTDTGDFSEAVAVAEATVINMLIARTGNTDDMLMVKVLEKQMDYIAQALAREIMVTKRKAFNWSEKKQEREFENFRWLISLLQWHAFRHTLDDLLPLPEDG